MPTAPLASDVLHLGEFGPPVLACVLYLTLFGVRARTLRRQRRPVVGWRAASFAVGVLSVALVRLPPFDSLAHDVLLWTHDPAHHPRRHLVLRFAEQDDERQARVDLANVHGVLLSNERAQRAAAAGAGERLRERVLSESAERTSDLGP